MLERVILVYSSMMKLKWMTQWKIYFSLSCSNVRDIIPR